MQPGFPAMPSKAWSMGPEQIACQSSKPKLAKVCFQKLENN
jgi:hypothetical protein